MDKALVPEGVKRAPLPVFLLWMLALAAVMGAGIYAGAMVLLKGLNLAGLNDYFGFGLYIAADLGIIALGAGAFFSGFLYYGMSRFFPSLKELKNIINYAVIVGFVCYTGALLVLLLEIGQPLRGWFGYWHANVHSMLTEVIFCISCYAIVLTIEFLPILLENRKLEEIKPLRIFGHSLHEIMAVFALTGTFLSCFHQGSLGGVPGVMFGRPFAFREGLLIWPWTFFLFVLSAVACGPAFTALTCKLLEKITGKQVVKRNVYEIIGKVVALFTSIYVVLKTADTLYWAMQTSPGFGFRLSDFYQPPYGMWLLTAEILVCGFLPAIVLQVPQARKNNLLLFGSFFLICAGIVINRFVMTVQALAIPVMPFDQWEVYIPTFYEWAPVVAMIAYCAFIISLAYRYLPVFPQEAELNPVKK